MKFSVGLKTDPIEYRYSFPWLLGLLSEHGIELIQYGTSLETYALPDDYFREQREIADRFGIRFWSCFSSHRELGGCFSGNRYIEEVTISNYRRLIEVGSLLGARYVGANPGSVNRDSMEYKPEGIRRYLQHMKRLSTYAKKRGLKALTIEPMSCDAEPPSTPDEIELMMSDLGTFHDQNQNETVPVYLCGDVAHGVCDREGNTVHGNMDLFALEIPYLAEFHFKNTDSRYDSTFGFCEEERQRGIIDVSEVMSVIAQNSNRFPVDHLVGHLEIGGPKLGRNYSDHFLEKMIAESLSALNQLVSPYIDSSGELLKKPLQEP